MAAAMPSAIRILPCFQATIINHVISGLQFRVSSAFIETVATEY